MEKKLVLVLDLDHTLLHSVGLGELLPSEEYLLSDPQSVPSLYRVASLGMVTKLRPFIRTFLEEASKLCVLYIYTMGSRTYAQEMAFLLDPDAALFAGVFSRKDCTVPGQKSLNVVPHDESLAVILDDTVSVWQRHARSLIPVPPYDFFASSSRGDESLAEQRTDESVADGALAAALQVLRRVHRRVFEMGLGDGAAECGDVRDVLAQMRQDVLGGCKIAFAFTAGGGPGQQPVWRMAEKLGALCAGGVDETVTHVVSMHASSPKARWAVQHCKFLVKPQWIEEAYYSWQRRPEADFSLVVTTVGSGGGSVTPAWANVVSEPLICS